ncbi:MAG: hypothetical protein H6741_05485 [Alphaproteobacteria bacterium]|nr:hypothetical protein [Alphaproteobacteria bacterium]MCB9792159.1 hypothetical protein [Alphaproteobacteria bacterium]
MRRARMVSALLLTLAGPAQAEDPQTVRLTVVAPSAMRGMRLQASADWLGQVRTLELRDDGKQDGDTAGDGLWTGAWTGEPVTSLPLRIEVQANAESGPVIAYQGTELILGQDDHLAWRLHLGPPARAERTALPRAPAQVSRDPQLQVVAAGIWGLFLLNYTGWLVVSALRRRRESEAT